MFLIGLGWGVLKASEQENRVHRWYFREINPFVAQCDYM